MCILDAIVFLLLHNLAKPLRTTQCVNIPQALFFEHASLSFIIKTHFHWFYHNTVILKEEDSPISRNYRLIHFYCFIQNVAKK